MGSARRSQEIFELVVDSAPSQRGELVDRYCGDDEELRQDVLRLLKAYLNAGSFLERPMVEQRIHVQPVAKVGDSVGAFKLTRQIGEGGFGQVFVGRQETPVRREVAVKVIRPGMATKEVLARFEAERQALALMNHPNIARVIDAGASESGHPYFVMEFVDGVPITDYCDEHQLSADERIQLFTVVCEAVQHAHQKGIIHRDLKPTNILVTQEGGRPIPKVIDFGVAKAIDRSLIGSVVTRVSQMVGTPIYMSPEQAGSDPDIDTRSDVYSLGVVLYELLTGSTPIKRATFQHAAHDEICRVLREIDPPKPSNRLSDSKDKLPTIAAVRKTDPAKLSRMVSGDLDWIVMKSLEKDRTRRYQTPTDFAEDLARFINHDVVEARPPSASYRIGKFIRKNRAASLFSASLLGILVSAASFSAWQAHRAKKAEAVAVVARSEAETERAEAQATMEFMLSALRSPDALRDGHTITVAELLDRAANDLLASDGDMPLAAKSGLLQTISQSYEGLGLPVKALDIYKQGTALSPDSRVTPVQRVQLGSLQLSAGKLEQAEETLREVLGELDASMHDNKALKNRCLVALGCALQQQHKHEEALTYLRRGAINYANDPNYFQAIRSLAAAERQEGRVGHATEMVQQLFDQSIDANGRNHALTTRAAFDLVKALSAEMRFEEALRLHGEYQPIREKLFGPQHPEVLDGLALQAQQLIGIERPAEAAEILEDVVERYEAKGEGETQDAYQLRVLRGKALSDVRGRRAEAEDLWRAVLEESPESVWGFLSAVYVAEYLAEEDRADEGLALLVPLYEQVKTAYGTGFPPATYAARAIAKCRLKQGEGNEAIEILGNSIEAAKSPDQKGLNRVALAETYLALQRSDEGFGIIDALAQEAGNVTPAQQAGRLRILADLLLEHQQFETASEYARRARELHKGSRSGQATSEIHRCDCILGMAIMGQLENSESENDSKTGAQRSKAKALLVPAVEGLFEKHGNAATAERLQECIIAIMNLCEEEGDAQARAQWKARLNSLESKSG